MSKILPFDEALVVARSLRLANQFEWREWCKEGMRPTYLPSHPDRTYKDGGWQGWVHWLGSGGIKKASKFALFGQTLAFARSLNLASNKEWQVWCKEGRRPPNVPSAPDKAYKDGGWQGWGHWLGTGNQSSRVNEFLPFGEALAMARSLNLASMREWKVWCKEGMRPAYLPAQPGQVYKDGGWQGWVHWLGSSDLKPPPFLAFTEALDVARSLKLASATEWRVWCKEGMRPAYLPSNPDKIYKDGGWQGWVHWLGSSDLKPVPCLPFAQALAFARSLGLANIREWQAWCKEGKRPATVPSHPERIYKGSGWQGWVHWLGSSHLKPPPFLLFAEALVVARSLGLASSTEWQAWCKEGKRPAYLPAAPNKTYKDAGWQGWVHWLGSGDLKPPPFLPFPKALAVAHSLGLARMAEWRVWCKEGKRPAAVPADPPKVYKDAGWQGWGHWLGTGNTRNTTPFLEFDEALRVARSLRLVSQAEWKTWCRSGARPANMPSHPDEAYVHDGWMGYTHWLCHANLDPPTTPAVAQPTRKRGRPAGGGALAAGKSRGKRQRR